jgi:hypothetical protein
MKRGYLDAEACVLVRCASLRSASLLRERHVGGASDVQHMGTWR